MTGFVPILLHREQGLWRVDHVETWKNLFFDNEGNYILRNSNTTYAFGLKQFGAGRHYDIAPLPLGTSSIAHALAALEDRKDPLSVLRRAEIWLRNVFVFPEALSAYEEALRAAPGDPLILQTLADRALYLGFPELAIPAYEKIGRGVELSLAEAHNDNGDRAAARHWVSSALEENPFDLHALRWQKFLADLDGDADEGRRAEDAIAKLANDPQRAANPVVLSFAPQHPRFEPDTTIDVNGTSVFDHSNFSVSIRNTSNRAVEVESVKLTSMGTAKASGLGDVRGYWRFPAGGNRLRAGESVTFDKQWGFTVDTGHEHVRYVFRTCWHGVDTTVRQCRTQITPSDLVEGPGYASRQRDSRRWVEAASLSSHVDGTPPRLGVSVMGRLHRLTEARHYELRACFRTEIQQRLRGLIPGVHCQAERAPMHRQKRSAAEQGQCLERVFRPEVHVAPGRMERANFEHDQIERPKPFADDSIFSREARVAAEEHRVTWRSDYERRPQGAVTVVQSAPRKVLRGRSGHRELGVRRPVRFPPVEFDDALGTHAPRLEMRADPERRHERHVALRELADGRVVEMVVVVVRDDHEIQRRHGAKRHRHGLEPLGTCEP